MSTTMAIAPAHLAQILRDHRRWVDDAPGGERANLSDADLRYADLSDADLYSADLYSADLRYADLRYADLSDALGVTTQ